MQPATHEGMTAPIATDPSERAFLLLVACADWPPSEGRDAEIREAHAAIGGDWNPFLAEVRRHHMTILAAESLRHAGIEPPEALAHAAELGRMRALKLSGETIRATEALAQAGIAAITLKGSLLSQALYGDPTLRRSTDLDLLVAWGDFRAARCRLEELGYRLHGNEPPWDDWRIGPWRRMAKDVTLVHEQKRIALELHHRLKSPDELLPGLGLAQATGSVTLADKPQATFPAEDLFVYLCTHAATSLWDRLKWLADLRALLADKTPQEIEEYQAHSAIYGVERCTALGLLLCQRLWGQGLPKSIVELPESDPLLASLIDASWQRLRGPERHHSSFANSFQRRHLVHLRDDPAYRRALSAELLYDREILERFKLPYALRGLYSILRIGVFLKRKLGLIRHALGTGSRPQSSIRQNRPA